MTEPDFTWRQSDLAMFSNCPRSFMLQRVLGHRRPDVRVDGENREPGTSDIGTLVHYLLNLHYGGHIEPGEDTTKYLHHKAIEIGAVPYSFVKDVPLFSKDWTQAISLAQTMFSGYLQWISDSGDDLTLEILAIEQEISFDFQVGDHLVRVTGQPDLQVRDLGERGIIDHKSRDASKWKGPRPGDFQLHTYAVLAWMNHPDDMPMFAAHNMLKRSRRTAQAKPPFFDRQPIRFTIESLTQHRQTMHGLLRRMVKLATQDPEYLVRKHHVLATANLTSGDCGWACPVKEVCDVMHGSFNWKEFADEHYPVGSTEGEPTNDD